MTTLKKLQDPSQCLRSGTWIVIFLVLAGCVSPEAVYTLGGATLGGLSGTLASAQNPKMAPFIVAGGTAMGGLLGGLAAKSAKSGRYAAFQEGYQRGASDTVKRQYWILQNLQKEQNSADRWQFYRTHLAEGAPNSK